MNEGQQDKNNLIAKQMPKTNLDNRMDIRNNENAYKKFTQENAVKTFKMVVKKKKQLTKRQDNETQLSEMPNCILTITFSETISGIIQIRQSV